MRIEGCVLPFVKPGQPVSEPFQVQCADGSMSANPMRRLVYRRCTDAECGHEYTQAAKTGLCPRCHKDTVINTGQGACVAPYRK